MSKSDGVPLFVEELTKTVLESSMPDRPVVPATLHDSLMARLDRLGPAKDIAQVASVIGQQFSPELLAAVVPYSGEELSTALQRLVDAGLAYRTGRPADETYSFKHALLRDVAYENLLRATTAATARTNRARPHRELRFHCRSRAGASGASLPLRRAE